MAFDGAFLHNTVKELNSAKDCHIEKIYQPSRDELVFLLRKKGFNKKLLMSVRSPFARVQFTETKYENPAVAPMFCMLARKHFSSAKLLRVTQTGLERVVEFEFEATSELGDRVRPKIVCELIGNKANIILVSENGRIIDALRRSDIESNKRLVQPGAVYTYPDSQGKSSLLECDIDLLVENITLQPNYLSGAILNTVGGLSPLICREIAHKTCGEDIEASDADKQRLKQVFSDIKGDILSGTPTMLLENGVPTDFTYTDISQYGSLLSAKKYDTFCSLLDAFYMERDLAARIKRASADILKIVNNALVRANKRLANRNEELKKCNDREMLRIYGELLKANLYSVKSGANFAEVQNYYDEDLKTIRIPLDSALSPAANATKYFKEYKKSCTAEQTLLELTREDQKEIIYLESVLDSIKRSGSLKELDEIREELITGGYIHKRSLGKNNRKTEFAFKEYVSVEGYQILVGKNNRQNDEITTKIAAKNDTWFHVKNIPGSHVVVRNAGKEISEETVVFAGALAAENSKAANSSQVPVDYTIIKNVKKPNGAKPGMVIYSTNQTVFVTPRKETK